MNYQEKREATESLNEYFVFTQSYINAETAAHEIAASYNGYRSFFEFEIDDLALFEKEVAYFIDEYYRCPMTVLKSDDGLES